METPCNACNHPNPAGSLVCANCGKPLAPEAAVVKKGNGIVPVLAISLAVLLGFLILIAWFVYKMAQE